MRLAPVLTLALAVPLHAQEPAKSTTTTPAVVTETTRPGLTTEQMETARQAGRAGATVAGVSLVTFLVLACISLAMQLLPILIAFVRGHPSKLAITVVALLTGWTCIGWFVALVWSLTGIPEEPRRRYYRD